MIKKSGKNPKRAMSVLYDLKYLFLTSDLIKKIVMDQLSLDQLQTQLIAVNRETKLQVCLQCIKLKDTKYKKVDISFRIWRVQKISSLKKLYEQIKTQGKSNPKNIRILLDHKIIHDMSQSIFDLDFSDEQFLLFERKISFQSWCLIQTRHDKCPVCSTVTYLKFQCQWKVKAYCSKQCRQKDYDMEKYRINSSQKSVIQPKSFDSHDKQQSSKAEFSLMTKNFDPIQKSQPSFEPKRNKEKNDSVQRPHQQETKPEVSQNPDSSKQSSQSKCDVCYEQSLNIEAPRQDNKDLSIKKIKDYKITQESQLKPQKIQINASPEVIILRYSLGELKQKVSDLNQKIMQLKEQKNRERHKTDQYIEIILALQQQSTSERKLFNEKITELQRQFRIEMESGKSNLQATLQVLNKNQILVNEMKNLETIISQLSQQKNQQSKLIKPICKKKRPRPDNRKKEKSFSLQKKLNQSNPFKKYTKREMLVESKSYMYQKQGQVDEQKQKEQKISSKSEKQEQEVSY